MTVISITHDIASARKITDRIGRIFDDEKIWSGAMGEIDDSGNAYAEHFVASHTEGPRQMQVRRL
jgi:phospholipid/cholesterol/gamma-HCH transport system ATP-binding protein